MPPDIPFQRALKKLFLHLLVQCYVFLLNWPEHSREMTVTYISSLKPSSLLLVIITINKINIIATTTRIYALQLLPVTSLLLI